ncbi:MAG: helix-turn-helix domain-containing protein [Oscillospiraceae bacterium]|nr:helix-turn-helix domain-containing protein [Oscillospiraceae bacterium]
MPITIGDIIRSTRKKKRLSQEELAHGICAVSTLSRIENGTQTPQRSTFDALMRRLDLPPEVFPSYQSEREVTLNLLKHKIDQSIEAENYDEAKALSRKWRVRRNLRWWTGNT